MRATTHRADKTNRLLNNLCAYPLPSVAYVFLRVNRKMTSIKSERNTVIGSLHTTKYSIPQAAYPQPAFIIFWRHECYRLTMATVISSPPNDTEKKQAEKFNKTEGTLYISKPYRTKDSRKLQALITFTPRKSAFDISNEVSGVNEFRVSNLFHLSTPFIELSVGILLPFLGFTIHMDHSNIYH